MLFTFFGASTPKRKALLLIVYVALSLCDRINGLTLLWLNVETKLCLSRTSSIAFELSSRFFWMSAFFENKYVFKIKAAVAYSLEPLRLIHV